MFNWLAKIIAHPKSKFSSEEQVKRFWMHFPIGALIIALGYWGPTWVGVLFGLFFLAYEVVEDLRLKDEAHIDLRGALAGLGFLGFVVMLLEVIL